MEVIEIQVPVNFLPERAYIAQVIFKEFLGVDYRLIQSPGLKDTYVIAWRENKIVFKDHFFSNYNERDGYLDPKNIPDSATFIKSRFTFEKDIPVIFGNDWLSENKNELFCGIDIFASAFFMLTRWEEHVITEKDYLDRFPVNCALSYKSGFLHRPLVNEIVEMLKKMIGHLDPSFQFSEVYKYNLVFTHDIDLLNAPTTLKEFAKDLIKRKRIGAFMKRLSYRYKRENPYDMIDYLMEVSEHHNTISRFYIMTGHNLPGRDGENYNITPIYREMLKKIMQKGHYIGFHPSLFTYNDPNLFRKEKEILENDIGMAVDEGRQHALRFHMPTTWQIWNEAGMRLDSTLGYSAMEGFRCGTGNGYTVFDVAKREKLSLKERPLIAMDTTLQVNRKLNIEECRNSLDKCINTGKKYNMPVTLLFHNLFGDAIDWPGWLGMYDELFMTNAL